MRHMMGVLLAAGIMLGGCAPAAYRVAQVDDKFSAPDAPALQAMQGNAIILNDPLGMTMTSQLNGFVQKDRQTGRILTVGFELFNVSYDGIDGYRWLAIRQGSPLVFLADGARIETHAMSAKVDHQVSRSTAGVSTSYIDIARYAVTPDEFRRIAQAKTLEFKVTGADGAAIYPGQHRSLLNSFQANLKRFYDEQIAPST